MATTVTNRAKFRALSCYLGGGTPPASIEVLLLGGTTPASLAASVADLNTVADLLAVSLVQELVATNYARSALASVTASEDDTNDRGAVDAADEVFASLGGAANDTIKAVAVFETGASDAARNLILVQDGLSVPTNGANVTVTIADLLRAT